MKNKSFYGLYMDFEKVREAGITPSDLDFVYLCNDGFLIIAEFKNEKGYLRNKQKQVLEGIVDGHRDGGIVLFVKHNKYVQNGDEEVDVCDYPIYEYYFNKKWKKSDAMFLDALLALIDRHGK